MNRIYKVIWNKARGAYAVVSEVAKARGKAPGAGVKRAAILAAALLLLGGAVAPQTGMALETLKDGTTTIWYDNDAGFVAASEEGNISTDGYQKISYGLDKPNGKAIVEALTQESGVRTEVRSTYNGKAGTAETWIQVGGSGGTTATVTTSKDGTIFTRREGRNQETETSTTIKGNTVTTGNVYADTVRVGTLRDKSGNVLNLGDVAGMQTELVGKADAADVYSKNDADGKFATKTDLDGKANAADVYTKEATNQAIADANPIVGSVYKGATSAGEKNDAVSEGSTVTGGWKNTAGGTGSMAQFASVSGGAMNKATGRASSISGGQQNEATGTYAAVGGGESNTAEGGSSSISGGRGNTAQAYNSSISGGQNNKITYAGTYASILGGEENTASGDAAAVGGGYKNKASGGNSFVAGGTENTAYGVNTTAIGGTGSKVRGAASVGIGGGSTKRQAKNAVAIGNGSMATEENEISFGDVDDTTKNHKLTNIADGSADTDAASVGQMKKALSQKADAAAVYTKAETDAALGQKADAASVYTKAETYSRDETDSKLAGKADGSAVTALENKTADLTRGKDDNGNEETAIMKTASSSEIEEGKTNDFQSKVGVTGMYSSIETKETITDTGTGKKETHESYAGYGSDIIYHGTHTWDESKNQGTTSSMQVIGSGTIFDLKQYSGYWRNLVSSSSTTIAGDKITVSDDEGNNSRLGTDGLTMGGKNYEDAQAALMADGRLKAAGGNFTVDKDGTVSIDATDSSTGKKVTHDSSSTFGPDRIHQQTQTWNGNRNEGTLSSMHIDDSGAKFELNQYSGERGQLDSSSSTQIAGGTITVSDDKGNSSQLRSDGLTVGGKFTVDANGKVSGMAAGTDASDAVNVGQLKGEAARLDSKIHRTNKELDQVGAMSMAIAGLHPLSYDEGDARFQLSAAMGTYDGTQALALGGFYHFNRDAMLSIGMTTDLSDADKFGANIGFTRRIGSGGRSAGEPSYTDLKEQLRRQDEKIARQDEQIAKQGQEIEELKEMVKQLAAKS